MLCWVFDTLEVHVYGSRRKTTMIDILVGKTPRHLRENMPRDKYGIGDILVSSLVWLKYSGAAADNSCLTTNTSSRRHPLDNLPVLNIREQYCCYRCTLMHSMVLVTYTHCACRQQDRMALHKQLNTMRLGIACRVMRASKNTDYQHWQQSASEYGSTAKKKEKNRKRMEGNVGKSGVTSAWTCIRADSQ